MKTVTAVAQLQHAQVQAAARAAAHAAARAASLMTLNEAGN